MGEEKDSGPSDLNSLFQLQSIQKRELSETEAYILSIFDTSLQYSSTVELAEEVVHYIDAACPPLAMKHEAKDYLWSVFDIILELCSSSDVTVDIQERLVKTMHCLKLCAKGEINTLGKETRVWYDFPRLGQVLDMYGDDPTSYLVEAGDQLNPESVLVWKNFNSFSARLHEAGVAYGWIDLMLALEAALETDLEPMSAEISECKVHVACEWMSRTAKSLLSWAVENAGVISVDVGDEGLYREGGPLYQGLQAICIPRWRFWLGRFEMLGNDGKVLLSEETREFARKAAAAMKRAEASIDGPEFREQLRLNIGDDSGDTKNAWGT